MATQLQRRAEQADRRLRITGFLPDHVLAAAIARVDVPLAPCRNVSASASIATWIGTGRRPIGARRLPADAPIRLAAEFGGWAGRRPRTAAGQVAD